MPRLTFPRLVPLLLALALSLGLAACGGSDDPEQADATVSQPTQPRTQETLPATTPTTTTPTTPTTTTPPATTPQTTEQPPATTPTTPSQDDGGAAPPEEPDGGATTPSQQTGGAATPASCGDVANGFVSGIQASGAACGEATGVAQAWLGAVGESGPESDVVAGGYACSGSRAGDSTAVTCIADGGRRVTFSANN